MFATATYLFYRHWQTVPIKLIQFQLSVKSLPLQKYHQLN